MSRIRLFLFSVLICLPALLLISLGAWHVVTEIPREKRAAQQRIGREYRSTAEELLEHPERATNEGERRVGWRQTGKIGGCPWGYVVSNKTVFVWHAKEGGGCRWIERAPVEVYPWELVFYWGGSFIAAVLIILTACLVKYFWAFMRERDDFLGATAHDLTTPLVGLRRMIGRNDDEARKLNERMILLVNNIKSFLKLGGKRKSPEMKSCDLVALCREASTLFAEDYAELESGPVSFTLAQDVIPPVRADETMLLQILWNLFGNDLKYAAPYGKVGVRFRADATHVVAEFVDEGPGMTKRQMRKAFNRYYRARTILESGKGGFGIGLCTAHEFARAMGGSLTVRANSPRGCIFSLALMRAE